MKNWWTLSRAMSGICKSIWNTDAQKQYKELEYTNIWVDRSSQPAHFLYMAICLNVVRPARVILFSIIFLFLTLACLELQYWTTDFGADVPNLDLLFIADCDKEINSKYSPLLRKIGYLSTECLKFFAVDKLTRKRNAHNIIILTSNL